MKVKKPDWIPTPNKGVTTVVRSVLGKRTSQARALRRIAKRKKPEGK